MISSPDSSPIPDLDSSSAPEERSSRAPEEHPTEHHEKNPLLKAFSESLAALATPEERISCGLEFMRGSISQEGSPRFREFWEARRLVLPFFKENLNPAIRSKLWSEYVELTVEARRLKEILEEQSSFAMEQIDLAIRAMEEEVANIQSHLAQAAEISFSNASPMIKQKAPVYNQIQKELNLFNTLASRLNGLRKEVMKTDMRIRFKTKFFKRLSDLGDSIFPKRKELIDSISAQFERDVDQFVEAHFKGEEVVGAPYYALREEIKSLQGMAKVLTLSSPAFTRTRLKLSECWDKVKVLEKEHKKEVFERRQVSSEQRVPIQTKIDALKARSAEMDLRQLDQEIGLISEEMRGIPLQRDDVRALRDELSLLRVPFIQAQEARARELEEAEREKLRLKKERVAAVKEKIARMTKEGERLDLESLLQAYQEIQKEIEECEISKIERQQLDRTLRHLKDMIADKKEHSLLNLSEDEKKTLENLRVVLQQKKQRRQEIKEQLELHRKTLGSSNLDFEKAMQHRELVDQDRERLEKANLSIQEIEQKIAELEG